MENKSISEKNWKNLWKKCNGSIYQSIEWAKIKDKAGSNPIFLTYAENKTLKAGIFAFEQNIKTPLGTKKILVTEGAPIFSEKKSGIKILKIFKEKSKDYFYGTIAVPIVDYMDLLSNLKEDIFSKAEYKRVDNHTILLDLEKLPDKILQGFKRDIRKRIKKLENSAIIVEKNNPSDLLEFFDIYAETMKKGGASHSNKLFYENLNLLIRENLATVWTAKLDKKIISGIIVLHSNNYSTYLMSGSSPDGHKIQANIILLWKAIQEAQEKGKKYFDMGGYDIEAKPGDKTYSINQFKERFGGKIVDQPTFSTNNVYPFFRGLIRNFKFVKKLYKKK